jgi:hypothetical protein
MREERKVEVEICRGRFQRTETAVRLYEKYSFTTDLFRKPEVSFLNYSLLTLLSSLS